MTRVSGVDDSFTNKQRLVQDETIGRTKTCKHICGDRKSGMADTMVDQKSGPALAGPAAPATTALKEAAYKGPVRPVLEYGSSDFRRHLNVTATFPPKVAVHSFLSIFQLI